MSEGTPKAIEMKGIVRNATKIGVQDGQAEDLINLRFMDGSWRASGNGRQIVNMPTGTIYQQLYVHTNIYHHLLGVAPDPNNGDAPTLWWFAEIDNDGVTFYPLDGTTDRSQWPEDKQDLPTEPKALTTVTGSMWVTQTGHLLTIIDESDDFEHFVFKTSTKEYIEVKVDANGLKTNRTLYPFGEIHFNCYCPNDDNHKIEPDLGDAQFEHIYQATDILTKATREKNLFSQHFFAIAAFKLYDGSYAYACNPVHLCPRENLHYQDGTKRWLKAGDLELYVDTKNATQGLPPGWTGPTENTQYVDVIIKVDDGVISGIDSNNAEITKDVAPWSCVDQYNYNEGWKTLFYGSDLVMSIDKDIIDKFDDDILKSLCIFITHESNIYPTFSGSRAELRNKLSEYDVKSEKNTYIGIGYNYYINGVLDHSEAPSYAGAYYLNGGTYNYGNAAIFRKKEDIIYDLLHSPFYLLKEYKKEELYQLLENPIVNIQDAEHKGILLTENLVQQKQLPIEATSRTTYLPKVSYMYNNRLHIANYKSHPFFGYPIDLFHLHNHSVKVQDGAWFKGVLPNLADNNDAYLQYPRTKHDFPATYSSAIKYFAYITVDIDTAQGMQRVVRYIEPYSIGSGANGRADFIESLNPLLTYPDARAKKMSIYILKEETTYQAGAMYLYYTKEVDLKPHPYLNMAYHIDTDLKQIEFSVYPVPNNPHALPDMQNTEEYFPNGLKVSKTDQPMFFPVENTYQVGSAEILALMSNTIAVGTGQTGDAPLYVFCKDGVYALYVDASGQMAYPNARILARDVCNNPRSVTPIDAGVVFTTDRGLMMISGEQVQEIGAPAEGDVLKYADTTSGNSDFIKIANGALRKIADLPNMVTSADFLTYLTGAIINYNHNMRELMVSNPNYPYSYVLDREGNWSRRDYTASQYVNNYPTSYRVDADGHFYKVDDEGNANTSLEHRKEADNKIFYLSNVIKLDSIGFKQAYRFVVRGYFETQGIPAGWEILGNRKVYFVSEDFAAYEGVTSFYFYYITFYSDHVALRISDKSQPIIKNARIYDANTLRNITEEITSKYTEGETRYCAPYLHVTRSKDFSLPLGCYVLGSYDGRKWACLGGQERNGKFTDIGCKVERTDVRFFRVCLSGQVTGKTRIDYMEMSAGASMLNTKIR